MTQPTRLPNFLGLGVPRAGTTWLHELLCGHPQVFVPKLRKEVHFFDHYYDRGESWYSRFFADASSEVAVGEITPQYLTREHTLARIKEFGGVHRFVVMLRHPVDRVYSHFGLRVRNNNYQRGFLDFQSDEPEALAMSRYSRHLRRFADAFGRDSLLVLIQEEIRSDPDAATARLAEHLGIEPSAFPVLSNRVNQSFVPKHRRLFAVAKRAVHILNRSDNEWLVRFLKGLGIKRLLSRGVRLDPIDTSDFLALLEDYEEEISGVEEFLGRPVPLWRERNRIMREKSRAGVSPHEASGGGG